ncbi:MAG: hypothetical protein ACLRM8_01145 [Alistipes sp.]
MTFEVSSDEYTTRGRYAVEGENYYIAVGRRRSTATAKSATRSTTAAAK